MSHRAQTFPRAQILQELSLRCQALAANDNRGFKQEFEVNSMFYVFLNLFRLWWLDFVKLNVFGMCANVFGSVKELDEVGKNLPTRAGDSEANREKNRYPYILPCKCKTCTRTGYSKYLWKCMRLFFVCFPSGYRWPLSRQAVSPKLPTTHWLHQRKFCACKNSFNPSTKFILSFSLLCLLNHLSTSVNDCVSVFRVEDQKETLSAPRVLCTTPWLTSGGWCGSKTSG